MATTKLSSSDVRLTWSGTGVFDVWRGTSPYFAPGDAGSVQIGNDVTSPFTAAGPSNRTAEFDFGLVPGSP